MKKRNLGLAALLSLCLLVSSCGGVNEEEQSKDILDEDGLLNEPYDVGATKSQFEHADKSEDHILLKMYEGDGAIFSELFEKNGIVSLSSLGGSSRWYQADIADWTNVVDVVKKLRESKCFETVDYDYISKGEDLSYTEVSSNPMASSQTYFQSANIEAAWQYMDEQGKAGGDSSVTVAVIDTGVDYDHEDLHANMWVNPSEIPGNGIDDDNDGYIDDIYGINALDGVTGADAGDPLDDHGHGTHVAGIIAASNNSLGSVGVAYNCKVMAIKAGNSSGYFTSSAVAKAITYAYDHGADVINMSFGGSALSLAVQEAIEVAYSRCVLVAAAGNDGLHNEIYAGATPNYPAALPYVVGVMSESATHSESAFTNYDIQEGSQIEYEVYAPGEAIYSCLPNNKYASWNGTSMASPVVAGVAALLRSLHLDRNQFSTKALMAQLTNTSETSVRCNHGMLHNVPNAVDAYLALTKNPQPKVGLYNYYTFDNEGGDGDGIIDAGETIDLGVVLKNKGGVAKDVTVSIDVMRAGGVADNYVSPTISTILLGNVGTYSTQDCGEIRNSSTNELTGVETPLQFKVAENCPNDYLCDINVTITWKNGLDDTGETVYSTTGVAQIAVTRGVLLPSIINEDTTLTNDKLYILNRTLFVDEGATLTIEPGTRIQAYVASSNDQIIQTEMAKIVANGNVIAKGTEDSHILFELSESYYKAGIVFHCAFDGTGTFECEWCDFTNLSCTGSYDANRKIFRKCQFNTWSQNTPYCDWPDGSSMTHLQFLASTIENCIFNETCYVSLMVQELKNSSFCDCRVHDMYIFGGVFSGNLVANKIRDASTTLNLGCAANKYWDNGEVYEFGDYDFSNNVFTFGKNTFYGSHLPLKICRTNQGVGDLKKADISSVSLSGNYFYGLTENQIASIVYDYYDDGETSIFDYSTDFNNPDWTKAYPIALDAHFEDAEGNTCQTIGTGTYKCVVTMSRDMDTSIPLKVCFGSVEPYADYTIEGDYVEGSKTVWEGSYTLTSKYESGTNYFTIYNGRADDNHALELVRDAGRLSFKIDLTSAQAMNLQATADTNGVHLSWYQDDYPTIAGYNIYKSTALDGKYTRANKQVLNYDVTEYLDTEVEPGVTYYYNFTVVLSDMSESKPSGKTVVTTYDSLAPNVYHTPVSVAYLGYNLIISATVTDNVGAESVTLRYRVKGETEYQEIAMSANNSKYSALIAASYVTSAGLEYYIDAYDGVNHTYSGTSESPHQVIVQRKATENEKGDVDGNGVIDLYDALLTIRAANNLENLSSEEFDRADLDSNGHLTANEALLILQYANGTITSFSKYL